MPPMCHARRGGHAERESGRNQPPEQAGPVTLIRFAAWVIGPESTPKAPRIVHQMECTTCGQSSEASADFEVTRDWAFRHVGRNLSHTGYREIIHRFWRAQMR